VSLRRGARASSARGQAPLGDQVPIEPAAIPGAAGDDAAEGRSLFSTFAYLVGTQGVTALLGIAYWTVAARLVPAHDVGIAAAALSTATLVATFGVLGIGTLLLAEIGRVPVEEQRPMLSTGLAIATASVLVLGAASLAASPLLGASLRAIGANPVTALLFVTGGAATALCATFDNAAIGLHRGSAQLIRASVASGLKIVLVVALILAGTRTASGMLVAWCASLAVSFAVCTRLLPLRRVGAGSGVPGGVGRMRERITLSRRWGSAALSHHVLNLALSSVGYVLPVIAALLVAPGQLAYFTTAQLVAGTLNLLPYLLALSLFAETGNDEALLQRHVRRTMPFALAASVAIAVAVEAGAPLALKVFGASYSSHGTVALRLLVLSGLPYVLKDHYVAIRRAQRRLGDAVRVIAAGTVLEIGAAAAGGAAFGLDGLCLCWVIATALLGLAVSPVVVKTLRGAPPATGT
jgi:O-antigen/teichoic acid export membrane protein